MRTQVYALVFVELVFMSSNNRAEDVEFEEAWEDVPEETKRCAIYLWGWSRGYEAGTGKKPTNKKLNSIGKRWKTGRERD